MTIGHSQAGGTSVRLEYNIAAHRLPEKDDGTSAYVWPKHMGEKRWIDMSAFDEAFRKALEVHSGRFGYEVNAAHLGGRFAAAYRLGGVSRD